MKSRKRKALRITQNPEAVRKTKSRPVLMLRIEPGHPAPVKGKAFKRPEPYERFEPFSPHRTS